MNEPRKIKRTKTVYVQTCSACGKEFTVSKISKETTCYDCQSKGAAVKAQEGVQFLIGAEIVAIKLEEKGIFINPGEISSIKVRTRGGKTITFEAGGWEERYIEWEEEEAPEDIARLRQI